MGERSGRLLPALRRRTLDPLRRAHWRLLRAWSNHFSRGDLHDWVRRRRAEVTGEVLNVGAGGEIAGCVGACVSIDSDPARGPDIVADVQDLGEIFAEGRFAAAFAIEVLEHVLEPRRAIAELLRVLEPGGRLFLSVPYLFETHDAPHDYWRFTDHGLRALLGDFEAVRIDRRNGYLRAAFTPLVRLCYSPHRTDRWLGQAFMLLAVPLYPAIALLDRAIRSDAATTGYHVAATKPSRPARVEGGPPEAG